MLKKILKFVIINNIYIYYICYYLYNILSLFVYHKFWTAIINADINIII